MIFPREHTGADFSKSLAGEDKTALPHQRYPPDAGREPPEDHPPVRLEGAERPRHVQPFFQRTAERGGLP